MGVYIKFDKPVGDAAIVGECLEAEFAGYSMLESVEFGLTKASEGIIGQSRRRGDVQFGNMTVTRLFDASSPSFIRAVAKGSIFAFVYVVFTASYQDAGEAQSSKSSRRKLIEIQLEDVLVVSSNFSGNGDESPTETIELNYTRLAIRYTKRDNAGAQQGQIMAGWDLELCQEMPLKSFGVASGGASASVGISGSASLNFGVNLSAG